MSKKTDAIVKQILKNVSMIHDEAILSSIMVFTSLAAKNPAETKAKAAAMTPPKPKVPMKATPEATENHILKYKFNDKDMIAFQSNGVPSDEVLAVCKGARMRFYKNAPLNPFKNALPFWSSKATEELETALLAVA